MFAVMLTLSLVVRADVTRHAAIGEADVGIARDIARSLLASADIVLDWQDCDARGECPPAANGGVSIDVRLVTTGRPGHDDVCGDIVRDARRRLPVVLVYLAAIDEKVRRLRLGPAGRSNPLISTLQRGHLIGVTIAHEIGHAAGLPHSGRGVMKADLDVDDVLALRQSHLTFLGRDRARMKAALAAVVLLSGSR